MTDLRLTIAAQVDIADLLDISFDNFEPLSRRRYEALIATALEDLRLDPTLIGSVERPELGAGIRTYHLRHSQNRARTVDGLVRTPRHLLVYEYYHAGLVLILRVLHDSMDLNRHIARADQNGDPG